MYLLALFFHAPLFCTLLLGAVAVLGDLLVLHSNLQIYKALFDNCTHATIGGLTWLVVTLRQRNGSVWFRLAEIGLCAFIASIIDLDHFFMAKSVSLKNATNLNDRPPLHCSTVPLIATLLLLCTSVYIASNTLFNFTWIFFAAFITHHIRDGQRRGLWFYRLGSTPPIPYLLYVLITMAMPYCIVFFMKMLPITAKYQSDTIFV